MKKKRENKSSVKLSGMRKTLKANASSAEGLIIEKLNINSNEIVAYYNSSFKLIFVLDNTINDRKPNVLLIINPDNDRKWDDIISNDYSIDLETVRPKEDNKYQKLDIEYTGLAVYNNLINDFKQSVDMTDALEDLKDYRIDTVRKSAQERLIDAQEAIIKTRETISKTGETMRKVQARIKALQDKIIKQKKEIGKEPTKQSASKILKTGSQIDDAKDKLIRSKKRLSSAKRRLAVASSDAEISREIIEELKDHVTQRRKPDDMSVVYQGVSENTSFENIQKQKVESMSQEVKPLFEKDPEIMDESIAFKPINFGNKNVNSLEQDFQPPLDVSVLNRTQETAFAPQNSAPISFTPPSQAIQNQPVIDSIKPVIIEEQSAPVQQYVQQPVEQEYVQNILENNSDPVQPMQYNQTEVSDYPSQNNLPQQSQVQAQPQPVSQPQVQVQPQAQIQQPQPVSQPVVMDDQRPASPITGVLVKAESGGTTDGSKPKLIYYGMLVILILLSIFTLWVYQKNTRHNAPDLEIAPKIERVLEQPIEQQIPIEQPVLLEEIVESPFLESNFVEPVIQPEPMPITEEVLTEPIQVYEEAEVMQDVYEREVDAIYEEPIFPAISDTVDKPMYNTASQAQFVTEPENQGGYSNTDNQTYFEEPSGQYSNEYTEQYTDESTEQYPQNNNFFDNNPDEYDEHIEEYYEEVYEDSYTD